MESVDNLAADLMAQLNIEMNGCGDRCVIARAPAGKAVTKVLKPTRRGDRQPKKGKGRLNIRIDDEWYDMTNWRAAHPAGAHWIDAYKNSDATEVRTQPSTLKINGHPPLDPVDRRTRCFSACSGTVRLRRCSGC